MLTKMFMVLEMYLVLYTEPDIPEGSNYVGATAQVNRTN